MSEIITGIEKLGGGSGLSITLLDSIQGSPGSSSTSFDYSGQIDNTKTLSDISSYDFLMLNTYVQSENIWILNSSTIIPINKVNQSSSVPTFEISVTKYYKSGNNFLLANNMFQVMVYKESNTQKWKCYGYQTLTNKASSAPTYRFELYGIKKKGQHYE